MFTIALGVFSVFPSRADYISCSKRKLIYIMPCINMKGFALHWQVTVIIKAGLFIY